MTRTCAQTKTRSSTSVVVSSAKRLESAFDTGDQLAGQAFRSSAMSGRVPEEQRRDDRRDEPEDEVGLAEVAPLEAARPLDLADRERREDADEHEAREDVDEERVPALVLEPAEWRAGGERILAVEDRRGRHEDRREEDEEAPEDEGVHEARAEPLEELALSEDDRRLVADPNRELRHAACRLPEPEQPTEEEDAPNEQPARDRDRDDERDRGGDARRGAQAALRLLSSAEIAGTTSCRSPITA